MGSIFLLFLLPWVFSSPVFSEIVETVEVNASIFSREPNSKNIVIISKEELEGLQIKDMADLFSIFTAVDINRRGPGESSFDITMRGSNFEQVLVLVDGNPLNNPQTGHFNSDFPFSIADIQRVEILRGGSSTAYGAGAFAGMVNIIMKKSTDLQISLTGGENKTYSSTVQAGKKQGNLDSRFSAHRDSTGGYYKGRESDLTKLTGGISFSRGGTLIRINTFFLDKDFGAKDFYAPYPSFESIKSYFYTFQWNETRKQLRYFFSYALNRHKDFFELDRFRPGFFNNQSDTTLHNAKASASYKNKGGNFSAEAGVELKRELMESSSMGTHRRNGSALYVNANYLIRKRWGLDLGLRQNFIAGRNSTLTFYAGTYHELGEGTTMRAGFGKSYRLPSFTELFYHAPGNQGDKNLEPEFSRNLETSFTWLKSKYQLDISVFYRDQDQSIDWIKTPGAPTVWKAVNIEKNDILGAELTQRFTLGRSIVSIGIERMGAINNKGMEFISKYSLRFPDFSVKVNAVYPIRKMAVLAANYRYKHLYKTTERGHFLDLVLTVPLKAFEVSLRADNLFNTIIEEIPGLEIPGRWFYVSISYRRR